ncbi:acyl carrier protein [Candidatus Pacearchaeota archaeon]|nr:acyl carrier protein [Candidatus Pacearchaeota archaeon]
MNETRTQLDKNSISIAETVQNILIEALGIDENMITPHTTLKELGAESIDYLDITWRLERDLGIHPRDRQIKSGLDRNPTFYELVDWLNHDMKKWAPSKKITRGIDIEDQKIPIDIKRVNYNEGVSFSLDRKFSGQGYAFHDSSIGVERIVIAHHDPQGYLFLERIRRESHTDSDHMLNNGYEDIPPLVADNKALYLIKLCLDHRGRKYTVKK